MTSLDLSFSSRRLEEGEASPCASLLKPLYAWGAGGPSPGAQRAIVLSSSEDTSLLVEEGGGLKTLLKKVEALTGVPWIPGETWGSVLVTSREVEEAYRALGEASATDPQAAWVISSMRVVVPWQRFGVPQGVALKAGWDLSEGGARAHRVTLQKKGASWEAEAILTEGEVSEGWREAWEENLSRGRLEALASMGDDLFFGALKGNPSGGIPAGS